MYNERSALWYGLGAVACWSTVATAFKLALAELDTLQMLFVACCCSSVLLLSVLAWQDKLKLPLEYLREAPFFYLGMALINPLFYYLVLFEAYDLLPAQQAMAINYSWALTLAVLAIPLLGQRPRIKDFAAAAIAYFGIIIIATQGALTELQFEQPLGTGLALLSTVIWALYWIFNTRNQRDAEASLCLNFLLATPAVALLCWWKSGFGIPVGTGLLAAVYIGFFEMGIAFLLWSTALRRTERVARIGNLIFLSPVLSLFLIALVLGEAIHPSTLIGLALIVPATIWQQSGVRSSS